MENFDVRADSKEWAVPENHENIKRHQHWLHTDTVIWSSVSQFVMHQRILVIEKATGRNLQKISV
jgi:hypothetical protein